MLNEYQKYEFYKENYLKKEPNNKLNLVEEYMSRDKHHFEAKAVLNFFKQLPKDVQTKYRTFDDFIRELREVDEESKVKLHHQMEEKEAKYGNKKVHFDSKLRTKSTRN